MDPRSIVLALLVFAVSPALARAQVPPAYGDCRGRRCDKQPIALGAPAPAVAYLLISPPRPSRSRAVARAFSASALFGGSAGFHVIDAFVGLLGGIGIYDTPGWETFRHAAMIPLVGPWLDLAFLPAGGTSNGWPAWLVVSGLFEDAMFLAGLLVAISGDDDAPPVYVLPTPTAGGAGLVVGGAL